MFAALPCHRERVRRCVPDASYNNIYVTRKQLEPADLRQGHVVRQVAAPYSVWQRFLLCPIESNVNENFKVIQNPGFLPDHPQNWTTGSLCHSRHTQKISERSVHNFLSYLADTQTDRQTNSVKSITSLVEVISVCPVQRIEVTEPWFLVISRDFAWFLVISPCIEWWITLFYAGHLRIDKFRD